MTQGISRRISNAKRLQMSALRNAVQKASASHLPYMQEAAMRTAYVFLLVLIALLAVSAVAGAVIAVNFDGTVL